MWIPSDTIIFISAVLLVVLFLVLIVIEQIDRWLGNNPNEPFE